MVALIQKFNRNPRSTQSAVSAKEAEKIAEVIIKLDQKWSKVSITKDIDHLKRIWADDFSYTNSEGTVLDKEANLAKFEDDTDTYSSSVTAPFKVRVYGNNFAVTAGDYHATGKDKDGKPFSRKSRFTDAWVRKQGVTGKWEW